jgi:hypothetical protein
MLIITLAIVLAGIYLAISAIVFAITLGYEISGRSRCCENCGEFVVMVLVVIVSAIASLMWPLIFIKHM